MIDTVKSIGKIRDAILAKLSSIGRLSSRSRCFRQFVHAKCETNRLRWMATWLIYEVRVKPRQSALRWNLNTCAIKSRRDVVSLGQAFSIGMRRAREILTPLAKLQAVASARSAGCGLGSSSFARCGVAANGVF